jgi:hypothetical protein
MQSDIYIPISGSSEESKLFEGDIARNEFADGVTWKFIRKDWKPYQRNNY